MDSNHLSKIARGSGLSVLYIFLCPFSKKPCAISVSGSGGCSAGVIVNEPLHTLWPFDLGARWLTGESILNSSSLEGYEVTFEEELNETARLAWGSIRGLRNGLDDWLECCLCEELAKIASCLPRFSSTDG